MIAHGTPSAPGLQRITKGAPVAHQMSMEVEHYAFSKVMGPTL